MAEIDFMPQSIPAFEIDRVHMVGIGGAGMSGIARILLGKGSVVSGSDMKESRSLLALSAQGAQIFIGHSDENIKTLEQLPTVVVTSFAAIPQDNPELVLARELGIPVVKRSDVLARLMQEDQAFLLAGTHGKTSTTSMSVVALQATGLDPSFAIGGQLNKSGTNAHLGTDGIFVAEADESDASFLSYRPEIAVVTNSEPDHLDFYGDALSYLRVFDAFAECVKPGGTLIVCVDDAGAAALGDRVAERQKHLDENERINVVGYGSEESFLVHPTIQRAGLLHSVDVGEDGITQARVSFDGAGPDLMTVKIPGRHMVLNAMAAIVGGIRLGAQKDKLIEGIAEFDGVRRRFEHHGTIDSGPLEGLSVYDDYAHHPTEVSAVLSAARNAVNAAGKGNVVVVFQPHLYSRTMNFASEFADALSLADRAVVLDIYGAREEPVEGVDSRIITEKMTIPADFISSFQDVVPVLQGKVGPGDIVLTVGAGTVTLLADEILHALAQQEM